ncbi:MAG: hypothetical protein V3W09_03825 [Nitrososphaerales archaeon]
MSDDVFTEKPEGENESALEALVGDGKKFGDNESLAKGKLEADVHIAKLETEAAETKEAMEKLQKEKGTEYSVADLMKAVKEATAKEGSPDDKPMSQEELQDAVKTIMQGEKTADTKASNRAQGNKLVLTKVDGNVEAAKALVAERAGKLGLTPAKLAELSEESPEAFAKLMGIDTSTASSQGTVSLPGVKTGSLDSGPVLEVEGHKTKSYFDAKRKEMGSRAYLNDTALQLDLQKSSQALGLERFNQ